MKLSYFAAPIEDYSKILTESQQVIVDIYSKKTLKL